MIPVAAAGLAAIAAKFFTDNVLYYLAIKALILLVITVTLPIVLKNVIVWAVSTFLDVIQANLPAGTLQSFVLQFEGVGGFFATHLRIVEAISVIITALTIRLALNMIPMVR